MPKIEDELKGEIFKTITEARETDNQLHGEKFERLTEASADALQKMNNIEVVQKETNEVAKKFEKQLTDIEKRVARTFSSSEEKGLTDFDIEYMGMKKNYLLRNTPIEIEANIKYVTKEFKRYMPYLNSEERALAAREYVTKTYQEGNATDGGFFVIPQTDPTQIVRRFETSPIRSVATVIPSTTLQKRFFINDGLTGATIQRGELQEVTQAANAKFGELLVTAHKMV